MNKIYSADFSGKKQLLSEKDKPIYQKRRLKLASFNIQTGIHTTSYRQYITRSWQHVWPTGRRFINLERIADFLRPFDLVGLQEVDGGGARSHYIVQTEYLAYRGGFDYWHNQINRRFGTLALHSNGLLSRLKPSFIHEYQLPGLPGRGALIVRFGDTKDALHLCILHLALSRRARLRQIGFVSELLYGLPYVVLMGDLNCEPHTPEMRKLIASTQLFDPLPELNTFPSWRPQRKLDHILVTPGLQVEHVQVLNFTCSDHLPIAMDIALPASLSMAA